MKMSITDKETQRAREAVSEVRLQVSPEEAFRYMQVIPHKGFLKSLRSNWRVNENGHATIQSICWLFCWATMGNNPKNKKTADVCITVFGQIFDHSYEWFAQKVPHELAKTWRYAKPKSLIEF
ncbi:MAG: hypothetical protein H8D56_08355 [Planctomycetes bacterium]|nr:hypothetical protein [Planctomycetota bacterium]MBL7145759.1 hypothetical protein [Phycisphaerae bacterium]